MSREHGFTLIELLIVVAVVGILSTLVIVQFVQTREGRELEAAQEIVVADIRAMTTDARAGKVEATSHEAPPAYGIAFTRQSPEYTIFADLDDDGFYTVGVDEEVRSVNLQDGEGLSNVVLDTCFPYDSVTGCVLTASVPQGEFRTNNTTSGDLTLSFLHERSGDAIGVNVAIPSGRIE